MKAPVLATLALFTGLAVAADQQPLAWPAGHGVSPSSSLIATIAASLNVSVNALSSDTVSLWAQMAQDHPDAAGRLTSGVPPRQSRRRHDWDFRVQDTAHPDHQLRVKQHPDPSVLGIDTVKQYTGYFDLEHEDKHLFYWFFESRNDPRTDPIVLWLNGGPGCSSLMGLFFELGPASISAELKPVRNPYSWNNNASVIFLDQPVNVGFSYSTLTVATTVAAGRDLFAFLQLFFKQFPEYAHLPFHLAGESYCGHYVPQFAAEILEHRDEARFNLTSILIGNGITDPYIQHQHFQPMACGAGGYPAVLSPDECQAMAAELPRCLGLIQQCYDKQSPLECVPALVYCDASAMQRVRATGLNVYDLRKPCEGDLCYLAVDNVSRFLNTAAVQDAVGAEVHEYLSCNDEVGASFHLAGDHMLPFHRQLALLLDAHDLPVLLYAGDKDYICNWLGNHAYSDALPYHNHEQFAKEALHSWYTRAGRYAGKVKNIDKFTFLRVFDAGHMVPYDQPEVALDMFNRWLAGDYALKN